MQTALLWLLFSMVLVHAFYAWSIGFHNSISDQFGFRQAQTAIGAQTMLDGAPLVFNHVPIFGPPWALPLEFPLYQWAAALLTALTGLDLIESGRLVSIICFLVTLAGVWQVLKQLHLEIRSRIVILILLLCSPIYLFWTRTFLIETCALALCIWHLYFVVRVAGLLRWQTLTAGAVLGSLAAMVKITTFLPFAALVACWLFLLIRARRFDGRKSWTAAAVLLALPLVSGFIWTEAAGSVDRQNTLMASFQSPHEQTVWVFGTFTDRFSSTLWDAVSTRILPDTLGIYIALPLLLALLPAARKYSYYALTCLGLFLVSILIFPRLNWTHSYYQTENALFLSAAVGFVAAGLMQRPGAYKLTGYSLLLLVSYAGLVRYYSAYFPSASSNNQTPVQTGKLTQELSKKGQVIIVRGEDWNSEIPFYSHRRAIMDRYFADHLIRGEVKAVGPENVGDILICEKARTEYDGQLLAARLVKIQQKYGVAMQSSVDDGFCTHYAHRARVRTGDVTKPLPFVAVLDLPKDGTVVNGAVAVAGWAMSVPLVKEIRVQVDGKLVSTGEPGVSRPDLAPAYPQYPGHPYNGFQIELNLGGISPGAHTIDAAAVLDDGSVHPVGKSVVAVR